MKLEVLDTSIDMFLEIDKSKLDFREEGTSRLILKTNVLEEGTSASILVLDFNEKYTRFIENTNMSDQVLFVQGTYQILKNKKGVPFAKVTVFRVLLHKKKDVFKYDKLRNNLINEFRKEDFKKLEEKYKYLCIDEEIRSLKKAIEEKDILKLKQKINNQELDLKRMEIKLLKNKQGQEYKNKIKWYQYSNIEKLFIDIDINKIELRNEMFFNGKVTIDLKRLHDETKDNHVLIKRIDNDRYELIMGIGAYLRAKILNKNVKAYITDLDREAFIKKINQEETKMD